MRRRSSSTPARPAASRRRTESRWPSLREHFRRPFTSWPMVLAGWLNRHQELTIEYLPEENRVLREMLGTPKAKTGKGRCHCPSEVPRRYPALAIELDHSAAAVPGGVRRNRAFDDPIEGRGAC